MNARNNVSGVSLLFHLGGSVRTAVRHLRGGSWLWAAQVIILRLLVKGAPLPALLLLLMSNEQLKRGTIYVYLAELEDLGYVTREKLTFGTQEKVDFFRITRAGCEKLTAWDRDERGDGAE